MGIIEEIKQSILTFNSEQLVKQIKEALDGKADPHWILNEGLISAMEQVGKNYESGEFFIPEMLLAGHTMYEGMALLKPYLIENGVPNKGKIIIGAVKGDLHDIGKNTVIMMLEGSGYDVIDLGVDVAAETFVDTARTTNAQIVGLSALLTTTMSSMENTIKMFTQAGLRKQVKIIVGGAPLSESYARRIGADGYAPDASRAVHLVRTLLQ